MYISNNVHTLLGKRFKVSFDDRLLFLYYSKLYNTWSIYLVGDGVRGESPLHPSLKNMTIDELCKWLNNPNYSVSIK